jgi:hypothetical protein
MYPSARKYPELAHLSSRKQNAILKAALAQHDPGQWKRFVAALALSIGASVVLEWFTGELPMLGGGLLAGALFYGYLLWEINHRTRDAVVRYLRDHPADRTVE